MKKLIFLIIVIAAISYATWYRVSKDSNKQTVEGVDKIQQKDGLPVRTVKVIENDVYKKITISGQISPLYSSKVSSTVGERIVQVKCRTGQKVSKGNILVTLDEKTAKLALLQAKASYKKAAHELQKLRNGSRPEEIQAAAADLENAQSALKIAKIEYERQRKLYDEEATTLKLLQDAESRFQQASAVEKSFQAKYNLVNKGPRQEDIQLAESALELADIAVKQADDFLSEHYVKAAFDGVVTQRLVDPGDIADFNMPLFELMNIDDVYLDLPISELYIAKVNVGDQISFTADSLLDRQFIGTVEEIDPKANMTDRTFTVRVMVSNSKHELLPGMFVRAELIVDSALGALVIPEASIHRDVEGKYVWVAEPGKVEIVETPEIIEGQDPKEVKPVTRIVDAIVSKKKRLTTGIRSGDLIEVKSGLQTGENIIEMGSLLEDNARVVLENEDAAEPEIDQYNKTE